LPIDSLFVWLFREKKEIATDSLRWPQAIHQKKARNSASERFVSLTDEDVKRRGGQQKDSTKDAQRRSIDEVIFAK